MKLVRILLILALAVSLLAVTACDKNPPADTTEDTTAAGDNRYFVFQINFHHSSPYFDKFL
jgi:hypothetical protein